MNRKKKSIIHMMEWIAIPGEGDEAIKSYVERERKYEKSKKQRGMKP